jgi:hypothetical protein
VREDFASTNQGSQSKVGVVLGIRRAALPLLSVSLTGNARPTALCSIPTSLTKYHLFPSPPIPRVVKEARGAGAVTIPHSKGHERDT